MRQQYKITLGDDLRSRLDEASKTSGRPVSEEIRVRLEGSLDKDLFDNQSRELATAILEAAREVEIETGAPWHRSGAAHRTFRRAMVRILSKWRPADYVDNILERIHLLPFQERQHASHPLNDADELGIALADDVLEMPDRSDRDRVREAREQTLRDIVKLQQERENDDD
jgi:predicted DNA-binding protein